MPSTNTSPLHIDDGDADGDGVVDDPDAGKDLTYMVPTVGVGWDTPPSFNTDPGGSSGGDALTDMMPNSEPINFDGGTVRAAESNLLAQARNGVSNYEGLRAKVDSVVHGTFWGPPQPDQPIASYVNGGQAANPTGGGSGQSIDDQNAADQRTLADIGEEFARNINPLMQKALAMQSAAFQQLGSYIALINASGQAYAHTDRAARFPDPPGPVTS
ncbi:hypothetical protein [Peterkaempfera griseoplana]|uniref:hypothetical protein n=1 Tax=Peterkaempfera griseoplana TaxID=66896 RepID=UPI0006E1461D|nr:hypothetical protein [Peterkaempfera griseoplana]